MPDITMCQRSDCPRAHTCYRFVAKPNSPHQSYQNFEPESCTDFMPITYYIDPDGLEGDAITRPYTCTWTLKQSACHAPTYTTECGNTLRTCYGGEVENGDNVFCRFCGGKIEERENHE